MSEEIKNYPVKVNVELTERGLIPADFEGLWRLSQIMHKSGLMPKGINTPESVFVAVQMGLEVGLSPMAAVQNIAVINGRPAIWGDAVLALVRGSGLLEDFVEEITGSGDSMIATCTAVRKGQASHVVRSFGVSDAKLARLWGKDGPWLQYPRRMLQMRARSWALRDGFSDVLRGFRQAEEQIDAETDDVYFAPPVEARDIDIDIDIEFFDAFGEKEKMNEFVALCCKAGRKNEKEIKSEALGQQEDFMKAYTAWVDKNAEKTKLDSKNNKIDFWADCEAIGFSIDAVGLYIKEKAESAKLGGVEIIKSISKSQRAFSNFCEDFKRWQAEQLSSAADDTDQFDAEASYALDAQAQETV